MKIENINHPLDEIDLILRQWEKERPDLDVSPMGPIGRIKRSAILLEKFLENHFSSYDLSFWEFDMLATLRRSGSPYKLSPTELFSTLMITSGTMTHRLKKLEQKNLIERIPNIDDGRSSLVQLTDLGVVLINQILDSHVENERKILSVLTAEQLDDLNAYLSILLRSLESQNMSKASNN
ncbi:MarR family transcriptional regulator [Acinetobacter sp. AM]|uniref:MarR family winged helix-turn-helix transcriptional regulator n=1 Tax=Acinetobacter sp. AM TaxID=2170730 RepID=UPI000DE7AAE2|nr:MarR family transcriptional regulator [Acinetobacter sp. AM]PWB12998.1 MarR family transcriptional regulator [Acinetobacter sp. AM]